MPVIKITGNHMQHSQDRSTEPPGSIQMQKRPHVHCSGVSPKLFSGNSLSQGKVDFRVSDMAQAWLN